MDRGAQTFPWRALGALGSHAAEALGAARGFAHTKLADAWPATEALVGHAPSYIELRHAPSRRREPPVGTVLIEGTATGEPFQVLIEPPLVRGLVALLEPGPPDDHHGQAPVPTSAAEAGLVAAIVAAMVSDAGLAPRCQLHDLGVRHPGLPGAREVALLAPDEILVGELDLGGARGGFALHLKQSHIAALAALGPPLADPAGDLTAVSVRGRLLAARAAVRANALRDVTTGDVVAFPGTPSPRAEALPVQLRFGRVGFGATLRRTAAGRQAVVDTAAHVEPDETRVDRDIAPDPGGDLLSRIPVTLVAELGEIEMSAADVARLGPGAIIDLDTPVGEQVDLRIGGRIVGRGELVEIDGSLGVRLTEVML